MTVYPPGLQSGPHDVAHHARALAESRARELAQLVSCTVGERAVVGEWQHHLDAILAEAHAADLDVAAALLGQRHRLAVAPAPDDAFVDSRSASIDSDGCPVRGVA